MIITDIHAHVFPDRLADKAAHSIGDFYGTPMYSAASVDRLLAEDGEADISYSVICNSAVTPHQVHDVNNFLAAAAASHPSFIGFGSIYPGMDGFEEELDRMMALGLRGLKIHPEFQKLPIDDPSGIETYRAVAKRGLPVLFHMGDDRFDLSTPQRLMNLLRQVPDLHVIAAHFGGWRAWELSYENPLPENVLYDTSGTAPMIPRDFVLRMLDRFGAERFLFGSDFPMWKPASAVAQIRALGLDRETLSYIFHKNFMNLFPDLFRKELDARAYRGNNREKKKERRFPCIKSA